MRLSDWETRLSDYISLKRSEPFEYGSNDCCAFAAGAVQAISGEDFYAPYRGQYSTEFGALRALQEIGQGDVEKTIDALFPEIGIGHAQRGDLAFFDGSVGVVMGGFAWFVSDEGLERVPRAMWDKAWGVYRG
jgi:hypothetical protein